MVRRAVERQGYIVIFVISSTFVIVPVTLYKDEGNITPKGSTGRI